MPSKSPFVITLSDEQRMALEGRAGAYTESFHRVQRAKIVLLAADGVENKEIAARLDTTSQRVHRWRKRFYEEGIGGLKDRKRSGRPRSFPAETVVEVKALACQLPASTGVPLSRWSCAELAKEAVTRGIVGSISASTVWRILDADAIRPWLHRMWIFPRDPDFAVKAARALDLYSGVFEGEVRLARTST